MESRSENVCLSFDICHYSVINIVAADLHQAVGGKAKVDSLCICVRYYVHTAFMPYRAQNEAVDGVMAGFWGKCF